MTVAKYEQLVSGLSMSVYTPMSADEIDQAFRQIAARKNITRERIVEVLAGGETFLSGQDFHGKLGTRVRDASAARWAPKTAAASCACKKCGTTNPGRFTTLPAALRTCDDCA